MVPIKEHIKETIRFGLWFLINFVMFFLTFVVMGYSIEWLANYLQDTTVIHIFLVLLLAIVEFIICGSIIVRVNVTMKYMCDNGIVF